MKKLIIIAFICAAAAAVPAQTPPQIPIDQREYVRLLYEVEADPSLKPDLIEKIRKRGIGFRLTSGLRSLTASKTGNDSELRRTLEEANRRRENPESYQPPDPSEAARALERAREATLAAVEQMPDFVVKQRIRRSFAYAGTGNFKSLDHIIVGVSYRASGQEEYKLLSVNGVLQADTRPKGSYSEVGGTSSTGEFVSVLATVFKQQSETRFNVVDTDLVRGRRTIVYEYSIGRDKSPQQITANAFIPESTVTGIRGRVWIDRENFRVLKLESVATEITVGFPVTAASRMIDYDWVEISGESYLLPSESDVRLTFRQGRDQLESRNVIQFRDYQKFGTEVIITDEDDIVIPEEGTDIPPPPPQPPARTGSSDSQRLD